MQYPYVKRYPLIGVRTEITATDPGYLNPVSGFSPKEFEAIDKINGMTVRNIRNKLILIVINADEVEDLIVTPIVTALISGYSALDPPITIAPDSTAMIGPFSASFENEGAVEIDFSGDSSEGYIIAGQLP